MKTEKLISKQNATGRNASQSGSGEPAAEKQLVATCQLSPQGELLQANSAFYQLTGIPETKPREQSMQAYVHPLDYPLLNRKFLLAATTGKTYEAHVRMLRANQNQYQSLHLRLYSANNQIAVEAAPQLQNAQAFFQGIEQLNAPAIIYDDKFNLLRANTATSLLLGYQPDELESSNPLALIVPDSLPGFTRTMRQMIRHEMRSCEIQLGIEHKQGHTVWVQFSASRILTTSQDYFMALLQDISPLKTQQQQAMRETKEMRFLLERIVQDLRGPIRSLLALHPIAELECRDHKPALEYFNYYNTALSQLSKVVDNVLNLNELKRKKAEAQPVNMHSMVQRCLKNLSSLDGFYKVDFDIRIEVKEEIALDERLLGTVLHNLLENAIRFSSNHSTPKIRIGVWKQEEQLTLEIADNGLGIPEEIQDTVFDMFVRAHADSSGAGLGLFIVKSAVEKLNGNIRLRSKARRGTWFKINIPLA